MIIQYGVGRSGTTLIYQILNYLFPGKVQKTHNYISAEKTVISLRDFRDCVCSRASIYPDVDISIHIAHVKDEIKILNKYYENNSSLILRYEKFINDFDYIFDELENYFDIKIKEVDRTIMQNRFNIEQNKKIADKMGTFDKYDKESLIHGSHINKGKIGQYKDYDYDYDFSELEDELKEWIY